MGVCVCVCGMNSVGWRLHLSHYGVLWRWRPIKVHSAAKDSATERCQTASSTARYHGFFLQSATHSLLNTELFLYTLKFFFSRFILEQSEDLGSSYWSAYGTELVICNACVCVSICLCVCIVWTVFSIDNVVCLLSYVNMCACHVYFTVNFLTYLLHMHVWSVHICLCVSVHVCFSICSAVHAH